MEKQSTGRVKMKLMVSVLALFLLMACGVFMGACKSESKCNYVKSDSENVAATCGSTGYDVYVCTDCGDRYAVPTYATGKHNFVNGHCSVCGISDTYDDAELKALLDSINAQVSQVQQSINEIHKHNFSGEAITVEATCYASGFVAKKCECGSSAIVSSIDKLDHEWAKDNIIVPATCTSVGEVYRKCVNCDATVLYQTIPVAGHKFGSEMEVIVPATCTTEGYKAYRCSECGETSYTQAIPATEHKMEWRTKNTKGYEAEYSANCQHGERTWYHCVNENCPVDWGEPTEIGAKGGHIYDVNSELNETLIEASCTAPATVKLVCLVCKEANGEEAIQGTALGHEWERKDENGKPTFDWSKVEEGNAQVTKFEAATCKTVGTIVYACADCGEEYTYTLPVNPYAHRVLLEGGSPKEIKTWSQLTTQLASGDNYWNTVSYTHYICELCRGWLVDTDKIPEGRNAENPLEKKEVKPTEPAEGIVALETATEYPYTLITRLEYDYKNQKLRSEMADWKGIIDFTWHSWKLYDKEVKADPQHTIEQDDTKQMNDFGVEMDIGDVTCTSDGLHYYHCIENDKEHTEHVITPAIGHNFDIPNTIEEFEALRMANNWEEPEEGGLTMADFGDRDDKYVTADCTQYGVLFVSCTNCFVKESVKLPDDEKGEVYGDVYKYYGSFEKYKEENLDWESKLTNDDVLDCNGSDDENSKWESKRVAVTVMDGELVTVSLDELLVVQSRAEATEDGKPGTIWYFYDDDTIAQNIRDLEAFFESKKVEVDLADYVHPVNTKESAINGATIEKLYSAFLGKLPLVEEGKKPTTTDYSNYYHQEKNDKGVVEKTEIFEPLGHNWGYTDVESSSAPKDWTVVKKPVGDDLAPDETFDCTQRGITGRYCLRRCCDGEGGGDYEFKQDTLHQTIVLKSGNEADIPEEDKDYIYWLGTADKEGLQYYLYAKEYEALEWGADPEEAETRRAELTYEEVNVLFNLLREKEHAFHYEAIDENAVCGQTVDVKVTCTNKGCNVHHENTKKELKHLGHYGQYFTIGACGTAFGEDHSIITYDYCLDCGKRVGLERVEVRDESGKLQYNLDGTVMYRTTEDVVWTEGDIHLGKFTDVLPTSDPNAEIKNNYRHFPFNRDMIEGLISGAKLVYDKDSAGNRTISADTSACDYVLYSTVWSLIDIWYNTNDDALLRSGLLSGFVMTNENHGGYTNGWTARCYDCYNMYFNNTCEICRNGWDGSYGMYDPKVTHYFILIDGGVFDFSSADDLLAELALEDYLKANPDADLGTIGDEDLTSYEQALMTKLLGAIRTDDDNYEGLDWEEGDMMEFVQEYMLRHARAVVYSADIYTCNNCDGFIWRSNVENGRPVKLVERAEIDD